MSASSEPTEVLSRREGPRLPGQAWPSSTGRRSVGSGFVLEAPVVVPSRPWVNVGVTWHGYSQPFNESAASPITPSDNLHQSCPLGLVSLSTYLNPSAATYHVHHPDSSPVISTMKYRLFHAQQQFVRIGSRSGSPAATNRSYGHPG
jgi:hypothetical protein